MKQLSSLYTHTVHPHKPLNVNDHLDEEYEKAGFNQKLAVSLTKLVGSMWCAYAFTALAIVGLLGLLNLLNPITFLLATWVSQMFLQLVFLPILSVGQSVLGRKQELMAEEQYATTGKSYHDIEQLIEHMNAQDEQIVKLCQESQQQTKMLAYLQKRAMGEV